jgi:hypothetical protein
MRARQDIGAEFLPDITYTPRPDATAEAERNTLGAVYRVVLNAHRRGNLSNKSGPRDAIMQNTKGVSYVDQRPG